MFSSGLAWVIPFFSSVRELPFSNFMPVEFTLWGWTWPNSETCYQFQKLLFFGVQAGAQHIRENASRLGPMQIKRLGSCKEYQTNKKLRTPLFQRWEQSKYDLMYQIVRAKFFQNPSSGQILQATEPAVLVEASPHDQDWGIGQSVSQVLSGNGDTSRWGQNNLGRILMQVRAELIQMTAPVPVGEPSRAPTTSHRRHIRLFKARERRRQVLRA